MLTEVMKIVISGHLRRVRIREEDGTKKIQTLFKHFLSIPY